MRLPRLCPGDRVGLVAPAGPVPDHELAEGVAWLTSWGLEVVVGEHVSDRCGYLAGTDSARAEDFQRMWTSDVRAVFCARGGYGCLRMIDLVDLAALRAVEPKILVGSSDVTLLHELVATPLGVASVFGPMPATTPFLTQPTARDDLYRALFEPGPVTLTGTHTMIGGRARGTTVGGNASLLVSTPGAADHVPPPPGSIALIEDVTEDPYRLDRILLQLKRSGWFDGVAGIAFGSFDQCGDPEEVYEAVRSVIEPLRLPTVWELGFGHLPDQRTVSLGVTAELDADARTLHLSPALT
jgi:muramoyltetrapeptide carboxypeptidase